MAKQTADREDWLREATALTQRTELQLEEGSEPIVIGFRKNGAASFLINPDQVYHFTSDGRLRRAYSNDRLIKAEGGNLIALHRRRTEGEVQLVRHPLSPQEKTQFLDEMRAALSTILKHLRNQTYTLLGQVPTDANVLSRVIEWFDNYLATITVAEKPNLA